MKNRSSNEKAGIYIIIFMVAIFVVVIVLYLLGIIGKEPPSVNMIIDNNVMYKYVKNRWYEISDNDYEEYNWKKYDIYQSNENIGRYSVYSYDKKFYVFNDNGTKRDPINVVGDGLYLGGNIKSSALKYEYSDLNKNDVDYVHKVLDAYDVDRDDQNKYTYRYKVSFDFDDDSKKEDLFVVSNLFSNEEVNHSFSFIFIRDDTGKTKMIYNRIYNKNENLVGCYAYLFGIIKVDGEDVPKIVTKCSKYSVGNENEYGLYQYKSNKYELLLYSK